VDVDVVLIAYEKAGIYLDRLMRADYAERPDTYDTADDNNPRNPFFTRRVRNLFTYLKNTGKIVRARGTPAVGDLIFYDRQGAKRSPCHVVLVSRITDDGRVLVIDASMRGGVKQVTEGAVRQRGYEPVYYGELLSY